MLKLEDIQTDDAFEAHLKSLSSSTLLVVYFYASWAAPCAQMRMILETLAASYPQLSPPQVSFVAVEAESLPDVSETYNVSAVPYLVLQKGGKTVETISGCDATKVRNAIETCAKPQIMGDKLPDLPPLLEINPRKVDQDTATLPAPISSSAGNAAALPATPEATSETSQAELFARLENLVKAAPVMLFMKGKPDRPECGFSRQLVGLLREHGVRFGFFNILADEDVRQGLKSWADWPTFPQLWIKGELIGGLDIVKEELANDAHYFKDYSVRSLSDTAPTPAASPFRQ